MPTEPLTRYVPADALESAILDLLQHRGLTRDQIAEALWGTYPKAAVWRALTRLRRAGAVYRTPDGWYKTDVEVQHEA